MSLIRQDLEAEGRDRVVVAGSWGTNAGSAIDQTTVRGAGFTVLRTAVGIAEVTFSEKYNRLEAFWCVLGSSAQNSDRAVMPGVYTAPTATALGKIQVLTYVPSTGAAGEFLASNADNRVNFVAIFRRTAVSP